MKYFSAIAAITAALSMGSVQAQSTCFSSLSDFSFTGVGNSRCIEKGDFNNDGHEDLILGNYTTALTNQMAILLGNGDGGFGAPTLFTSGRRPQAIKAFDFNGDSNLDIVVVNIFDHNIAVITGTGTGTFNAPALYPTGGTNSPNGVDIGDFNGDLVTDIVVSFQASGGGFAFFSGIAGGTFNAAVSSTMGTAPRSITVNDFNLDGNLDVATANNSSANVSVRLGNGNGTFGAVTNFATAGGPFNIKSGFINSDANPDIVVSNSLAGTISILAGNGTGGFAAADNYTVGSGPNMVAITDFDENGIADIAAVNNSENTISILLGTGSDIAAGVLGAQTKFPVIGTPQAFIEGDYNEDSFVDLAVPSVVGTRLLIMIGDGAGNLNTGENIATDFGPNGIAYGNFNGDANSDLVVVNKTSNTFSYFAGNGDGTYAVGVDVACTTAPVSVAAGDVDGDGNLDVITANSGSANVGVSLGDGLGGFSAMTYFGSGGTTPSGIALSDINGDSNLDILVTNEGSNDVGVLLGDGTGNFAAAVMFVVGTTPKAIVVAQFDINDSFLDFAVANSGSNNITVWYGDGAGSFTTSANFGTSTMPLALAAGDLNSDGRNDIVVACNTTARVSKLIANGTSTFAAAVNHTSDLLPQSIVMADFNNDGFNDVATANKVAVGSPGSVSVFMGNGTGSLGTKTDFITSNNSIGIVAGNIDAGTYIDLAVVNFDANNVSILLNNTAIITAGGPTTFCEGGNVTLTSSIGNSYTWSNGSTTQAISATVSGNYNVVVSNISGLCSSTSNTIAVTVNPAPEITAISGDTILCTASSTTLVAAGSGPSVDVSWYDAPTGGTLLSGTDTYVTPVLGSSTTFYIDAVDNITGCTILNRRPITITVGDLISPVITGIPSNFVVSAGASCNAVVSWTEPNATDECTLVSFTSNFASGSTFPLGTTTVTYTAEDGGANVSTGSFTVTVNDNTNPVITGTPATINVNVAPGTCAQTVTWTAPSATDNCTLSSFTSSHTSGSSFPVGTTTVTYTATDAAGHTVNTSFNVVVTDNILPVISGVPSNITLNVTPGTCGATATWTSASASDNCALSSFTESETSGDVFPVGITTVNYIATDVNGNSSNASFTITVTDNELPTITGMPSDMSISTDVGLCTGTVAWTEPIANDNCSITSFITTNTSGSSFPVGMTTVTYVATDASGNVATGSFNVTVTDNTLPTFTSFPSNISQGSSTGLCGANITWTTPVATDNCGIASMTPSDTSGSFFGIGTNIVTYTIVDVNGNINFQSFTVNVMDVEAPVMSGCPTTITVCEGDTVNYTPPTATDNCSGMTLVQIAGLPSGSVYPVGTTLNTYRATDGAGNIVNCNFNVIVNAKPNTTLSLSVDSLCNDDLNLTLTGGSPSGGIYSGSNVTAGQFNPVAAGPGNFVITYTFTNTFGCTDTANDNIVVDDCSGVNENVSTHNVRVYPNPANAQVNLEIEGISNFEDTKINLINGLGSILQSQSIMSQITSLDLIGLENGVYFIQITGPQVNETLRLVIQK